jgi:RNA polymerase sigma factor (sigma-70 family)
MPTSPMVPLLQHLRRAAFLPDAAAMTDGQLLERFLSCREEAAFEALVRRHGAMVLGVCRRVLRNGHDAEDAFQATFLVLVKKAASIVPREMVGNWLYGVAHRTALKAKAMASHRRAKERQVRDMSPHEALDTGARHDLEERLDHELSRLPDKYRAPVLLCDLEGKPRREAARQLGVAEGTLSSRLARARRLLAQRLSRRGRTLSAGALAVLLSREAVSAAVPAPLLTTTVKAATLLAAGQAAAAVVSAQVAALTEGVLKAMLLSKLKTVMAVVVALSVAALGMGTFSLSAKAQPQPDAIAAPDPPSNTKPDDDESEDKDKIKSDKKEEKVKIKSDKKDKKGQKIISEQRSRVEEVVTKSFTFKKAPRFVVETFNGPIEVATGTEGTANAKVTKRVQAASEEAAKEDLKNVVVQMTQERDTIRITAKTEGLNVMTNRGAAVELQVPAGAPLELHSSNGRVTVSGPSGDVTATSSNGRIEVKGGKGKLHLKTSNGRVTVDGGTGPLDLNTTNGRIEIKATKAAVKAHTTNGAIHFSGTLSEGDHTFNTSNGSVTVTLPADARFRFDAQTSNGKVTSQFSLKDGDSKKKKTHLSGTVGDNPTTTLKLHTSNGNIEVKPDK